MAENTKKWEAAASRYRTYIKLEKRLAQNSVESYMRDLRSFAHFILRMWDVPPQKVEPQMIERYMAWLFDRGREKTSQARALSGVKSFFNFLMISDKIENSPAEFILSPKFGRQLPDILSTDEIDRIIATVDTSSVKGLRDSAMLELLYSCGLRVSELVSLKIQDLFFGEGYIRVIGKGDKQRLVPISATARERVHRYLDKRPETRSGEDALFLNNRGSRLTRVMVSPSSNRLRGMPESKNASAPTPSATRSQPICSKEGLRSGRCRRCSDTKASSRPRSTPTSTAATSGARSRSICRSERAPRKRDQDRREKKESDAVKRKRGKRGQEETGAAGRRKGTERKTTGREETGAKETEGIGESGNQRKRGIGGATRKRRSGVTAAGCGTPR